MGASPLRLGTRGSPLARWQADWVANALAALGIGVEIVPITTSGDQQQAGPIGQIGTQGVFTKEIQRALLERRIDLAVHSLKDLPTEPVAGLRLAAVPPRESTRDALIGRTASTLTELPHGAVVGTGSLRRKAQLWRVRPDLQIQDVRGNVETRLRKLDAGEYDALVLAEAGLKRLELTDRISELIAQEVMLPAVGQGALGIETRAGDAAEEAVGRLNHIPTQLAVLAERSLLSTLRGGCLAPVGALGTVADDGKLHLQGVVLSPDGRQRLIASGSAETRSDAAAIDLGVRVAEALIADGAAALIEAARN